MYADGYGQKAIAYCLNGNVPQRDLLKRYCGKQPTPPRTGEILVAEHDSRHAARSALLRRYPLRRDSEEEVHRWNIAPREPTGGEQFFNAPHLRIVDEKLAAHRGCGL